MAPRRSILVAAIMALLLLPSAYMAWRERDMAQFGFPHDDGIYFVTAKSLAQGTGYRIISLPDQPWQTKYPPLLPFGLSLVWRVAPDFPANLAGATLFAWLWLPIWLAVAYRLLQDLGLDWRVALGLCGAMAVNHRVAHFAMRTQPELMVAALWTASAVLVMNRPKSWPAAAFAGLLAGAAYLTKTAALPMVLAGPFYYALRRRLSSAAAFFVAMLPAVAGWNLWIRARLEHSNDWLRMYYTDYFGYHLFTVTARNYPSVLLKNADALLMSLGGLLLGWAAEPGIAERVAGILMLVGTIRHCRRIGITPYHLFAAGYIVLLLVWHYPPNERFLLPVLPVLLAGLWSEVRLLYELLARSRRTAGFAFASAAAVFLLYWNAAGWPRFSAYCVDFGYVRDRCHQPAYEWIARNTPGDAQFLASEDALLYLSTGRRAMTLLVPMRYFYEGDREGAAQLTLSRPSVARHYGLQYIFDAPRDWWRDLLPNSSALSRQSRETLARSSEVREVYSSNGCAVYQALPR